MESDFKIPCRKDKIAVLYEEAEFVAALQKAKELREEYDVAVYEKPKKLGKFIDKLEKNGFDGFYHMTNQELKLFE